MPPQYPSRATFVLTLVLPVACALAQTPPTGIKVEVFADPVGSVDFGHALRPWDGFGVNYVETAQTRDYEQWPQNYGGFDILTEPEREEILDLIFGPDGLRPALGKAFLDPWHEGLTAADNDNEDPWDLDPTGFDHESTTNWMRYFYREGLKRVRSWGGDMSLLATLYGPAPWMTEQKFVLGRDIDDDLKLEVAEYMVSWVKYLREVEGLPVDYLSFHNEGDAYYRWPRDGSDPGEDRRDYNAWWRPSTVVEFLQIAREMLDRNGLEEVGLTPGETQNWARFDEWGYAAAIASDPVAVANLDLVTSHSFAFWDIPKSVYYGDWRSSGIDLLRASKAEPLHAWVSSMSWGDIDAQLIDDIRRNIYITKVNGVIPWTAVKRGLQWVNGDPNSATAINVQEGGGYKVSPGYYFYKQVSRAGQPGMAVAAVASRDPALGLIAFASNGTRNPDAFLVINVADEPKDVELTIRGSESQSFAAYRSSPSESYADVGKLRLTDSALRYTAPAGSVTTFFGTR